MATTQLISVDEYLQTTYRPDVDYVEGEIQERHGGEFDHADVQTQLSTFLRVRSQHWGVRVVTEIRVQTSALRFRVPDVCVLDASTPREQIIRNAPMLCIEVLSPSVTMRRIRERVKDYLDMGVPQVWVFDTGLRTATVCIGNTTAEYSEGILTLPGTPIAVPLDEIFGVLDQG